jgi:hypothetical protein
MFVPGKAGIAIIGIHPANAPLMRGLFVPRRAICKVL